MLITDTTQRRLASAPLYAFTLYAAAASFVAYCCMYAFRKPFTAGLYEGQQWWGIHYKIVLVMAQVAGYAFSKFIGIRFISGLGSRHRGIYILALLGIAELALLGFACTPAPWSALWMLLNGLPLGLIWGLVFSYLEGRRSTEVLAAVLSVNFIISSGFVKTVGRWLLDTGGVSEHWMPCVAGLLFVPPLLLSVWMLERLPPPGETDRLQRAPRSPLDAAGRRALFARFAPGIAGLTLVYLLLTILRDVRDNFAVELWRDLGYGSQPSVLTSAELPVALLTLAGTGSLIWIKNNWIALTTNHILTVFGAVLLLLSTLLFQHGYLSPLIWMVFSGFGLFLGYVLFNGILFDRLLAAFRQPGNVGFLMYIADAIGYMGSVAVLLWRNFGAMDMSWLDFYTRLCYGGAAGIIVVTACSWWYFFSLRQNASSTTAAT